MKLNRRQFLISAAALASGMLTACRPNTDNYQQAEQAMKYRAASAETVQLYYPPAWLGVRGDHDGSEVAPHSTALKGLNYTFSDAAPESFDLIVIGAGMSGLTAAYEFQKQQPQAKILILDNHDDFGGHAKRNEFTVNNQLLITYGGSESLDAPKSSFSETAHGLLKDLGVDWQKLGTYFQQDLYEKQWGLVGGVLFRQPAFAERKIVKHIPEVAHQAADIAKTTEIINQFPIPDTDKAALIEIFTAPKNYLSGKKWKAKQKYIEETSYYDFLKNDVKLPEKALAYLTNLSMD